LLRFRLEGLGCGAKQVVQDIFWLWLRAADLCFVALGLFPFVSRADCAQALRDEVLQSESQSEQRPDAWLCWASQLRYSFDTIKHGTRSCQWTGD
jgi:hypothetical protein